MDEDVRGLVDKTVNDLEYKFISSIRRVTQVKKKRIGFLQGHGELTKQETWDVRQSLELDYVIGDVEIKYGPTRAGDIPHSLASIDKAKELLGYAPQFSIEQGIEQAIDWYWKNLKEVVSK
mgnify:CR=1 FL=1